MRLLHTADWHVGKSLHGITRLASSRATCSTGAWWTRPRSA